MNTERYEVTIFLHNGNVSRFVYEDTRERVEDRVSETWYTGFLEVNPQNPKRKIHILPEEIRHIRITKIEEQES
jgi:hypothetical protein